MKDDIANELFVMNNVTVEKLFELGADAFTLYAFYYKTAKWQKTMEPWANNEYVMKNLGWGRPRLLKTKAQLEKAQMIGFFVNDTNLLNHLCFFQLRFSF